MPYNTSTDLYQTSKYIYDPTDLTVYATLQDAINGANADGGGLVTVRGAGVTITESLTLYDKIRIKASDVDSFDAHLVTIVGQHTLPSTGSVAFEGLNLATTGTDNIAHRGSPGTGTVSFIDCNFDINNGFILFADDGWGILEIINCSDTSTASGIVSNSSDGPTIYIESSQNIGTSKTSFLHDGGLEIRNSFIDAPIRMTTATPCELHNSRFDANLRFGNGSTVDIFDCYLNSGTEALTLDGGSTVNFHSGTVNVTGGTDCYGGTGTLTLGTVDYVDSKIINAGLLLNFLPKTDRDTPFIVGLYGQFSTFSAAIGAGGTYIKLIGNVTENITFAAGLTIVGVPFSSQITGTHIPDTAAGTTYFSNIQFNSTTHFFSSAGVGSLAFNFDSCRFNLTGGGTGTILNIPNWTATIQEFNNCEDITSGSDTSVFNCGAAFVEITNCYLGINGTSTCSGALFMKHSQCDNDIDITGGSLEFYDSEVFGNLTFTDCDTEIYKSNIYGSITTSGTGSHDFYESHAKGDAGAAITHNGTGTLTAYDNFFYTTGITPIDGTGTIVQNNNSLPGLFDTKVIRHAPSAYAIPAGDTVTDAIQIWKLSDVGSVYIEDAGTLRAILRMNTTTDTLTLGYYGSTLLDFTKIYCGNDGEIDLYSDSIVLTWVIKDSTAYGRMITPMNNQTGTTYTLALTDCNKFINLYNANAITLTLPQAATADLPDGFQCTIIQAGAGQVTIVKEGTDTISSADGLVKTRTQYSAVTIVNRGDYNSDGTTAWFISGDLTA